MTPPCVSTPAVQPGQAVTLRISAERAGCRGPAEMVVRTGLHPLLLAAPVVAGAADALTTLHALSRVSTAVEGNPAMREMVQHETRLVAFRVAAGTGFAVFAQKLARRGNRKTAKVVALLPTVLHLGLSLRAERVIRGAR